jgi:hypothetical protein
VYWIVLNGNIANVFDFVDPGNQFIRNIPDYNLLSSEGKLPSIALTIVPGLLGKIQ